MILALQTADNITHAQLFASSDSSKSIANLEWESGRQLSDALLERLIDFLATKDATFADLTGIIIFSGPGSFTSLRIGHTVVNALADSLAIPVVGARDPEWIAAGFKALSKAQPGRPTVPHYGAEANITKPKS